MCWDTIVYIIRIWNQFENVSIYVYRNYKIIEKN